MTQSGSGRPLIQPVSQVELGLAATSGDVLADVRAIALDWIAWRAGGKLPEDAWKGDSFELVEVGAQRTEAVALTQPRVWAARLDDADRNVPRRTWTTEIGLGQQDGDDRVVLGCRLQCVSAGERRAFVPSVPRFVRDVVDRHAAYLDGVRVSKEPWFIDDASEVERLVRLILDPQRRGEVIVLSLPEGSREPQDTAVNAREVAKHVTGTAHVAIVSGPMTFELSDALGREFSVFRQAVRAYRPGFDPSKDPVVQHPLGLPERIARWDGIGPEAYERLLISQALRRSVTFRDIEERVPPFDVVRRHAGMERMKRARDAGSSTDELLQLYESEVQRLSDELENTRAQADSLLEEAESERDAAIEAAEQTRATNQHLRRRIESLQASLAEGGGASPEIPEALDGFEDWCERHLSGEVELHTRAYRGIKKSRLEDVRLIYQALLILRDWYVPMRRRGDVTRADFDAACSECGLTEGPTFSGPEWGHQNDAYIVRFQGEKRLLDRHLKKGSARDDRYCFRLYFFWDEREEKVVVGWLPSHLDTRAT